MRLLQPFINIDKRFKYFVAISIFLHAIFLSYVFIWQTLNFERPIGTITINLNMPGSRGGAGNIKKRAVRRAPRSIQKENRILIPSEKSANQKRPAERHEQISYPTAGIAPTSNIAAQSNTESSGTSGSGNGYDAVSSNQLDSQPSLVKFKKPVYTVKARKEDIEGVVVLKALVAPNGKIKKIKVLKSIPQLDASAINAVKQWRFTAISSHGNPVYVWIIIPIRFQLE